MLITEIDKIEFETFPSYVLFIENFATFNRYVHEVTDESLVVYTNGFPSPNLCKLISLIDGNLPRAIRFYHWGDIDVGGLKIFRKVEKLLTTHVLEPHLMTYEILQRNGKNAKSQRSNSLKMIASSDSRVSGLARSIIKMSVSMTLEQEILDPVAPVCYE